MASASRAASALSSAPRASTDIATFLMARGRGLKKFARRVRSRHDLFNCELVPSRKPQAPAHSRFTQSWVRRH